MIAPIVEGQADEEALPILLRRLIPELGVWAEIARPVRARRPVLVTEAGFRDALRKAASRENVSALLAVFDLDEDCARTLRPNLEAWAAAEVGHLPCAIVMPRKEYEAWFLAALESLRGKPLADKTLRPRPGVAVRQIAPDATYKGHPEEGSKGVLDTFLPSTAPYHEVTDQPTLSGIFDLRQAYQHSSSFRKLVKELSRVLSLTGQTPTVPPEWEVGTAPV